MQAKTIVLSLPFTPFHSLSLLLILLLASCARQGYPTGGPKDETPPVALAAQPANESRHFNSRQFYIPFDEYVVLKNATENVLVSPPLKNKPEYTTKGRGILVKINDTLLPNTTYLFQFKEAIADFNEGNLLPSYEYVFSTGADMDTLMLAGRVLDGRSGKPWKEQVSVLAYRQEQCATDTVACHMQPAYVTRADKEGHFTFHYLPAGRYRLVALEDKNRNLRLDADDPAAWDTAFYPTLSTIDSNALPQLRLSAPVSARQRLTGSEFVDRGIIRLTTALPMQNPTLQGEAVEWRLNARRDTLTAWCLNAKCDSTVLIVSDRGLQDTLKLRYRVKTIGKTGRRAAPQQPTREKPLMRALCSGSNAYYDDLRLAFERPIVSQADSLRATVIHTKDSTQTEAALRLDSTGLAASIDATLTSGEAYRIFIPKGMFTDLYGNTTDSLSINLTPKDYATLTLHLTNAFAHPLVVEVLDSRDTVLQRQSLHGNGTLRFRHLAAGEVRIRAIVDADGNGRWTPGDYRLGRQPEEWVMFEKTLQMREKWESEEKWHVAPKEKKTMPVPRPKLMDHGPLKPQIPSKD